MYNAIAIIVVYVDVVFMCADPVGATVLCVVVRLRVMCRLVPFRVAMNASFGFEMAWCAASCVFTSLLYDYAVVCGLFVAQAGAVWLWCLNAVRYGMACHEWRWLLHFVVVSVRCAAVVVSR